MKKINFNEVIGLMHVPETVPKMNSFIYCRIVKLVGNTIEKAKVLLNLLAYSFEYTTKP